METWKILLIIFGCIVVLAPAIGVIIGKQGAKRKNNIKKSVLNQKEKIIYSISILIGVALLLTGIFWPKQQPKIPEIEGVGSELAENGEIMGEEGETPEGGAGEASEGTTDSGGTVVDVPRTAEVQTGTGGGVVILD